MLTRLRNTNSSFHFFQPFNKSSGNLSSQGSFSCQVFYITLLAGSRTGPNMPSGSKVELIVDKHPRLVSSLNCFCGSDTFTPNETVSVFHCSPSALSMGSLSRSRFFTVLSSAEMAANTSLMLKTNFVRRKLSFFNNCINCSEALRATLYRDRVRLKKCGTKLEKWTP